MPQNDGGPAFPGIHDEYNPVRHQTSPRNMPGMSLRDWFAGQALAGMASISMSDGDMIMGWGDMSRAAYKAADAMLLARGGSDEW